MLKCLDSWQLKESFLNASLAFFSGEFADFDNIDVHGIRVSGFRRGREGLIGLMGRFGVPFGDFISVFPLGLEGDGFLVPIINGEGDCIHGHDTAPEGRGDAGGEVSDKDVLVGNACEGGVVLEVTDILNKGRGIGVVLPFGHAFGEEPGDGIASDVMVFECSFELLNEVREGSDGDDSSRDSILSKGGCPSEGGSFGHIRQSEGDLLVIVIIDFFIDK